jgi:GTP-binding protein
LSSEFYAFGLGDVYDLSATNGSGTGEILDELVKYFNKEDESVREEDNLPRIAIVGRPNVGKSSMVNALTGQERNIVTDISGTTRDAIHTSYKAFGFDFLLIDTAGIRKKAKVTEDIEYYSVLRSVRTIENADVCLFMIDASEGIQKQDLSIYYMIEKNSKGVVVLVNKWDLVEKDHTTMLQYEEKLREELAPFNDVPIIFTSNYYDNYPFRKLLLQLFLYVYIFLIIAIITLLFALFIYQAIITIFFSKPIILIICFRQNPSLLLQLYLLSHYYLHYICV